MIDSSFGLLSRVINDATFKDEMTMLPFNKPVLVVSGPFSQDDINQYTWCLKNPHIGSWIRADEVSQSAATRGSITSADERLDIPQIRLGPGLLEYMFHNNQEPRYVMVIQGRTGAHKVKVMVANTREQAATVMMHEALNGYSTVFSTAYDSKAYDGLALQDLPLSAKFRAGDGYHIRAVEGGSTVVDLVCENLPPNLYGPP
jgi:hypothetical protein